MKTFSHLTHDELARLLKYIGMIKSDMSDTLLALLQIPIADAARLLKLKTCVRDGIMRVPKQGSRQQADILVTTKTNTWEYIDSDDVIAKLTCLYSPFRKRSVIEFVLDFLDEGSIVDAMWWLHEKFPDYRA